MTWIFIHQISSNINDFSHFHTKNQPNPYTFLKEPIFRTISEGLLLNVSVTSDIIITNIKKWDDERWRYIEALKLPNVDIEEEFIYSARSYKDVAQEK